jgi:hypothetical protein
MESNAQVKQLNHGEVVDIFLKVLSDTYMLKKYMLSQLPAITLKTQRLGLKILIVNSGCSLETQILRMDVAYKYIQKSNPNYGALPQEGLNYEKFLFNGLSSVSLYDDAKLINHLVLIGGIQVGSFRLLEMLSKSLSPKRINRLMKLNLGDALKFERHLVDTYSTYV